MTTIMRFEQARLGLSAAVRAMGEQTALRRRWAAVDTAPATFSEMADAWHDQSRPFPVWAGGSDKTVYTSPHVNHLFRLWHDGLHVANGWCFSCRDELLVAALHVETVRRLADNDAALLMWIDTAGQVLHYADTGEFVDDQLDFAWRLWQKLAEWQRPSWGNHAYLRPNPFYASA